MHLQKKEKYRIPARMMGIGGRYINIEQDIISDGNLHIGNIILLEGNLAIVVGFETKYLTRMIVWVLKEGEKGICYYWRRDLKDVKVLKKIDGRLRKPGSKRLRAMLRKFSTQYKKSTK